MHTDTPAHAESLERLLLGFHGDTAPAEIEALLRSGLCGIALYPRNFSSPAGLRAFTRNLRRSARAPLLIGLDQEGGTPFSLSPPFTTWPSPSELGRLGDATLVEDVARAIAVELRAAGVNTGFAPMLDLAVNPQSPVTKNRSFGRASGEVARLGTAFLRGLAAGGILGCAKHFPGHGDTVLDPHLDLPSFDGTRQRLDREDLIPFAAAIAVNVPMIMTAHILLPRIDARLPASLSPLLLEAILRRDMGFDGVILADDLGMGALARRYGCPDSAIMTLEAGTDIAMICHDTSVVPAVIDTVAGALEAGRFDAGRWAAGRARIAKLRDKLGAQETAEAPLSAIGCREHLMLAREARRRLAALEKNESSSA